MPTELPREATVDADPLHQHPVESGGQDRMEWSWPLKLMLFFASVVLPTICVLMSFNDNVITVRWQQCCISNIAALSHSGLAAQWMHPLLIYAMVCQTFAIFSVREFGGRFSIRLGFASGLVLSLHFAVLQFLGMGSVGSVDALELAKLCITFLAYLGASSLGTFVVACIIHSILHPLVPTLHEQIENLLQRPGDRL
ncbi:MAG: hypothetical protein KDA99_02160 [Planctomycetales bacterium]|nr:hypothetical protein [Planctomycetales bacterium]